MILLADMITGILIVKLSGVRFLMNCGLSLLSGFLAVHDSLTGKCSLQYCISAEF